MSATLIPSVIDRPAVTAGVVRPLLGGRVVVRTASALWQGTLLSCVKDSAWFVVDDEDLVVPLDELLSVHPT